MNSKTPWSDVPPSDLNWCYTEDDVVKAIQYARDNGLVLRCCGSQHSNPNSTFDPRDRKVHKIKLGGDLRKMALIEETGVGSDDQTALFSVGAGANMGIDRTMTSVKDPRQQSTAATSFFRFVESKGYAFEITGGISEQTM